MSTIKGIVCIFVGRLCTVCRKRGRGRGRKGVRIERRRRPGREKIQYDGMLEAPFFAVACFSQGQGVRMIEVLSCRRGFLDFGWRS